MAKILGLLMCLQVLMNNLHAQSELKKVVSSMDHGTWAELKVNNQSREIMRVEVKENQNYHIAGWTDDGVWDAKRKQFLYMGFRQKLKFIKYTEEDNAWDEKLPVPAWPLKDHFGHIYGNNAFDEIKGEYYHHIAGSTLVYKYSLAKNIWTILPEIKGTYGQMGTSIEALPEANCLFRHSVLGLWRFQFDKNEWIKMEKIKPSGNHTLSRYNSIKKEVLFVGGNGTSNAVVKITDKLKIIDLPDSPVPMNIRADKLLVNPVSGHYLLINNGQMYDLDGESGKYVKVENFIWPYAESEMPVPATLYDHKVIMFVDKKVMLYKPIKIDYPLLKQDDQK